MPKVFINGKFFEVLEGNPIAVTYQTLTLGSLSTRETNYSSTIKGPVSQVNRETMEGAELINPGTNPEYRAHTAEIQDDGGGPLLQNGRFRLSSTNNIFSFNVYEGFRNLADKIKSKSLWDLSVIPEWDHLLSFGNVTGSWDNTEGYIYSIFQDGSLIDLADGSLQKPFDVMLPGYFISSIIEGIIEDAGFYLDKSKGLYQVQKFLDMVLPFTKDKLVLSERIYPNQNLTTNTEQVFSVSRPVSGGQINPDIIGVIDFEGITEIEFPVRQIVDVKVSVNAQATAASISPPNITYPPLIAPSIVILDENDNILATSAQLQRDPIDFTVSLEDYTALAGTKLRVGVAGMFFNHEVNVVVNNATVDTSSEVSALAEGVTIGAEMVLPESMKQDAFLKGILNMFCAVPVLRGNTITFELFDSLSENMGETIDLSPYLLKPVNSSPNQWYADKKTQWGNYAQKNNLEYKEDTDKQTNESYRVGSFPILDETLPAESTQIKYPFAASDRYQTSGGIYMIEARLSSGPDELGNFQFEGNIEQRIGYIRRENVRFRVGTLFPSLTQEVPFLNFVHPEENINLTPNSLLANYFKVFTKIMERPLRLTAEMDLPLPIVNKMKENPFVPVQVDKFTSIFYRERIINYIVGRPTKIELTRIV